MPQAVLFTLAVLAVCVRFYRLTQVWAVGLGSLDEFVFNKQSLVHSVI